MVASSRKLLHAFAMLQQSLQAGWLLTDKGSVTDAMIDLTTASAK
jgi:hypothetical protein